MLDLIKLLDSFLVFGNKLTNHHKHQLKAIIKIQNMELINWIHYNNYQPIEHTPFENRKWTNGKNEITESELFNLYLKE